MVGSLAGVIALVLFTIAAMDHPFTGAAELAQRPSSWCWKGLRRASSANSENIGGVRDRGGKAP